MTSTAAGNGADPGVRNLPGENVPKRRGETVYSDVFDFVTNYLSVAYARQVTDVNDTVWCPEWYRHPEAVGRLNSLWRAWEHYRHDPVGQSTWWLSHADPTMAKLFDPKGTFKYCGVRSGHKEMLKALRVTVPEDYDPAKLTSGMWSDEVTRAYGTPWPAAED